MTPNWRPQRPALRVAALAIFAVSGFAAACGSTDSSPPPAAGRPGSEGAAVYAASCASCHGDDLRGTPRGPSHLSVFYEPNHHGDDAFRSAIANGAPQHHWNFGDMPPIEGLSGEQIEDVIAFVRAEQQRLGFEQ